MSTEPTKRRQPRIPVWAGYIVVAIAAFILGAIMNGSGNCTGLA